MPAGRRIEGRRVRPGGVRPAGGRGPPDVHADALGQPVVAARRCPALRALERINGRLDGGFGFEHHFVRGLVRTKARMGLALAVKMALALGSVAAGRPERMRSLVDPGLPLAV